MADIWKPAEYLIHFGADAVTVSGYEYRDLGMHMVGSKTKPRWSLTHLGTGLKLCVIDGDVRTAFPIATEIAEAGDWGFISIVGYKDRFPDAAEVLGKILTKHAGKTRRYGEFDDDYREKVLPTAQKIAATR